MAVAHDALNPLGGLGFRVLLKWRADTLHENDEGEHRRDREFCESRTGEGLAGHRDRREPQMLHAAGGIEERHLHRGSVVRVSDSAAAIDQDYSGLGAGRVDHFGDCFARDSCRSPRRRATIRPRGTARSG